MNSIIVISIAIIWFILLILSFMVHFLYKTVEKSHKRNKTTFYKGEDGFPIGTHYPTQKFSNSIYGNELNINSPNKETVLIFTQSTCSICKRVYAILDLVRKKYSNKEFIILMVASKEEALNYVNEYFLNNFQVSLIKEGDLEDLGISSVPFSYLLSSEGNVLNKGVVNTIEHFDILFSQEEDRKIS
ncbi:TlpA family protein disulfide reductase [Peribacillus simplex]|uniref:TlpA family protein disulfide reductase n=1 Tax=Peribacillus simplex TaxID=1478 RepID=UPI003D2C0ED3